MALLFAIVIYFTECTSLLKLFVGIRLGLSCILHSGALFACHSDVFTPRYTPLFLLRWSGTMAT